MSPSTSAPVQRRRCPPSIPTYLRRRSVVGAPLVPRWSLLSLRAKRTYPPNAHSSTTSLTFSPSPHPRSWVYPPSSMHTSPNFLISPPRRSPRIHRQPIHLQRRAKHVAAVLAGGPATRRSSQPVSARTSRAGGSATAIGGGRHMQSSKRAGDTLLSLRFPLEEGRFLTDKQDTIPYTNCNCQHDDTPSSCTIVECT